MSWDVFIQDLPEAARSVAEVPDDFVPRALGRRDVLIQRLQAAIPGIDFSDPSWGKLVTPQYAVDINIGDQEEIAAVTLRIRGSDAAVPVVEQMIDIIGGRAIDSWTSEFFDPATAARSLHEWRQYVEEN
jgi:hypothetical protein